MDIVHDYELNGMFEEKENSILHMHVYGES
jgi:hypothetical protein